MKKNTVQLLITVRTISLIIFASVILTSCRTQGRNKTVEGEYPEQDAGDGSLLFDGHTLDGWEITNFGPQGDVYVSGGNIILGAGDGCTGITWKGTFPENNYRVTLEARRVSGTDFFCGMTFPVGAEYCSFIVGGWGGTVTGLSSIDGYDAAENETTETRVFEKDQWYDICLLVKGDSIKAWIDNDLMVDFKRGNKRLSVRPEVELSKPFGIASWNTTAAIRNVRLELLIE